MAGRVLITGASGYIGSCIARIFAEAGYEVDASARTVTEELRLALTGCNVLELDVLRIDEAFSGNWDILIHTATANDIVSRDPASGYLLSTVGAHNVIDLAVRSNTRHLMFFSTVQVYGTEMEGEFSEYTAPKPETPYGLNHYLGEEVCRMAARNHDLCFSIVRPANVYGLPWSPTVSRETLVPTCFVKSALRDREIVLRSSGRQVRDFVSVRQVAEACRRILSVHTSGFKVFNVGSGETISILQQAIWVVERVKELLGIDVALKVMDNQPNEVIGFRILSDVTPEPLGGKVAHEVKLEIDKLISYFSEAEPVR